LKITDKDVRYVAELANLRLTEDEIARMAHDLDEILSHVDKIDALDTSGVEPMAQVLYAKTSSTRPSAARRPPPMRRSREPDFSRCRK
jgi:aspartyl-tRNA(Asn)/glutamyl-tRNA(Gln) amidotransferase subunit C